MGNYSKISFLLALTLIVSLVSSCSSSRKIRTAESEKLSSGSLLYHFSDNIYVGPQPTETDLARLKGEKKFEVIINVGGNQRVGLSGKGKLDKLEGKYLLIPILVNGRFERSEVERIEKVISANSGKRVFVHSSTGQLAAAWLAMHLTLVKGRVPSESLIVAKSAGLSDKKIRRKTESFLYLNRARAIPETGN